MTDVRTILLTSPWGADPAWLEDGPDGSPEPPLRSSALVVVDTDAGIRGVGETVMGYFCPEAVEPVVAVLRRALTDPVLGLDPMRTEACTAELAQRILWWGRSGLGLSVLSAVDMALWDIRGLAEGRPVHALLGGAAHGRLLAYASGGTGRWPLEATVDQARRYVARGFRALKLGTGYTGRPGSRSRGSVPPPYGTWYAATTAERIADERDKLAALRAELGPGIELAVDSHAVQIRESWSRRDALALARAIEPSDVLFHEEPLRYDDPEGYAELRRSTRVPIAGGECLTGVDEFRRWIAMGALDHAQPDASHVGGVGVCRTVARIAEAHGVGLLVHTGGSIGPGFMANLHVAIASPNARAVEVALAPDDIRRELLVEPLALDDGDLLAPTAPGLGIRLPDDLVERFPYQPGHEEVA
ncbi:MAG: mandelate racemase/muconate lactonizing enzyme family protein [Chloroflexi bacterium]|nr:mandelate racemase/muconate lactonizing enzyme family protein [Chloroflexota bacterium]